MGARTSMNRAPHLSAPSVACSTGSASTANPSGSPASVPYVAWVAGEPPHSGAHDPSIHFYDIL
ncbi:hypothetical protein BDW71DRAFT_190692 [Aspergillus fruticulosus]